MHGQPTIYVVDDDAGAREWLSSVLTAAGWRVRTYGSAAAFLDDYRGQQPGCLVLDLYLPDMSGLELYQALAERGAPIPVIFTTTRADLPTSVRAIKGGAVDVLEKPFAPQTLLARIDEAFQGEAEQAAVRERYARLTPREREVMRLIANGDSNKVIARRLGISPRTVETHRARVMGKMGAESVAALVGMAVACGLPTQAFSRRTVPKDEASDR